MKTAPHRRKAGRPKHSMPSVGDLRVRSSTGALVELVDVDFEKKTVCAVPYDRMQGHGRFSDEATKHPERHVWVPVAEFRDVTDDDIKADRP